MENPIIPLNLIPIGSTAKVTELTSEGISRRRMLDLGLIAGTEVESLRQSPSGDPIAYEIRGTVIALRSEEASKILVQLM
ncbi:FeoA family protein [Clostridium lundense]|uniref:FeoA family protein n=1 Tax=Clostridium lundense TaxID=319475 RepID=UPI000482AAE7|nr:FeoA family protein [Clostridium lundense]